MHQDSNTGDTSTLDLLILSCVGIVNRMAYRYCGAVNHHDDFAAVAMLKICEVAAYAQAHTTDPVRYLCAVARNAMIDEYHRLRRLSVTSLDAPLTDGGGLCLADVLAECSSLPAAAPASPERVQALYVALSRLSAHQRAAVLLRAGLPGYGAHSLGEAARVLTSSKNAVQMADGNGRRKLARDAGLREVLGLEEVER